MWNTAKRTVMGVALGALAIGVTGCATMAEQRTVAYGEPDTSALGVQPPRANTIYGMTRLMRSQGKTEQAELALIGLMKEYPNYSPAYNDLAEIRVQQGRLEEAVHYIERGLEIAPNDVVLLNNAGVCALMKQEYEAALEYFKSASMLAPYENRYRANVALATGLTGDIEGSRALYSQIVSAEQANHNAEVIQSIVAPPATVAAVEPPAPLTLEELALLVPAPEPIPLPNPVTTEETISSQGAVIAAPVASEIAPESSESNVEEIEPAQDEPTVPASSSEDAKPVEQDVLTPED